MNERRAKLETSAGGVVYHRSAGRTLVLLIRDSYENWGFPKGHIERGEAAEVAAVREVREETGLAVLEVRCPIETIDWYFRFDGQLIHKVCHFFLMESATEETAPQHAEGITECVWLPFAEAVSRLSYANARAVLRRAQELVVSGVATV